MRNIEIQKLVDIADELRRGGKYKKAISSYLDALKKLREDWYDGIRDESWQKKVISVTCNGMGIAYSRLGFQMDALDNFADAVENAPNDEVRAVAMSNLEKLGKALKDKTGVEFKFHSID